MPGPAIVLITPQLGENIGMVARAMLNYGCTDLRLVNPRDPWPNKSAIATSAGAVEVINKAKIYFKTCDAISDLKLVFAATARKRDMKKEISSLDDAVREIGNIEHTDTGILFGNEANGLTNDDISLADKILSIPVNENFSSLNLSQAVLLVVYELCGQTFSNVPLDTSGWRDSMASKEELINFFTQLEFALQESGFFHIKEKQPIMVRNIRNIFHRAQLTDQEVRTLRGVISSLENNFSKKD